MQRPGGADVGDREHEGKVRVTARRDDPGAEGTFLVDLTEPMLVLAVRREQDPSLAFRHSCRVAMCNTCGVRVDGNGVAESIIFGGRAGDRAALVACGRDLKTPDPEQVAASVSHAYAPLRRERGPSPFGVTDRLKETMWEGCGVTRDREGLLRASEQIEELALVADDISIPGPRGANYAWQEALDLSNQITVARTMVESALIREESRGSHYRSDFPHQDDDNWMNFVVTRRREHGGVEADLRPVEFSRRSPQQADPPAEDLERVRETRDRAPDVAGRP